MAESKRAKATDNKTELLIIGSGMATAKLLEYLFSEPHNFQVRVIGNEPSPSYNRILLSSLLAREKTSEDLPLLSHGWYSKHGVDLIANDAVIDVDTQTRRVTTESGSRYSYDKLVFATGSRAHIPKINGTKLQNVMGFRNQSDVAKMTELVANSQEQNQAFNVVVIGGGLLGLEAAHGLNLLGANVRVVHRREWLMNRQLDKPAGQILQAQLETRGICFSMGRSPKNIQGVDSVNAIELDDGSTHPADLVLFAAGIDPNKELAASAGIPTERAIIADAQLRTAAPGVFAFGECAQIEGQTFGLVAPIWDQAQVLASVLTGGYAQYHYRTSPTQLKVSGIDLYSAGEISANEQDENLVTSWPERGIYRRLIISENYLKGAILLGNREGGSWYGELIQQRADIDSMRAGLIFGREHAESACS